VITISPGLVNTGMIPSGGWGLLREAFYSIEAGALPALYGSLSTELQGGEFLENVPHVMSTPTGFAMAKKYQTWSTFKKDVLFLLGLPGKLIQQHREFGNMTVQTPNPVATESTVLRDAFFEWSLNAVSNYTTAQMISPDE
jgi:hypothetical protein